MQNQNYSNHKRVVKGFHYILSALLILGSIASLVNLYRQCAANDEIFTSALVTLLFICGLFLFWFVRQFPVKVQDRAIRAEESLRYFILTRKSFDKRLTMRQIIALRFASDDELAELADRAIKDELSPDEIKKAIKNWRPDYERA